MGTAPNTALSRLGIFPKEIITNILRDTVPKMFVAAFFMMPKKLRVLPLEPGIQNASHTHAFVKPFKMIL